MARAASATAVGPATTPAPPASAASFSRSLRLSVFISLLSVTGRSDHVQHFRTVGPRVAQAMGGRAAVVHAVACAELVDVGAELDVHPAFDHEQELLGVAVRVGLVSG